MRYTIGPSDSINEMLKKLKDNDELFLKSGIYKEKIESFNNNIKIIGENKENTIITNNDHFHKIMDDYNECNTFRTYTLYVGGNNVTIENVTIENSCFNCYKYGQAVALHVDGTNFKLYNSILRGSQDTLFTGPLPEDLLERHKGFLPESHLRGIKTIQIYDSCTIEGIIDFIFGSSYALFINCEIISKRRTDNKNSYIAAPSHAKDDKFGYLFYKCNLITKDNAEKTFLARPWRDYGTCAFIECSIGNHIMPEGFNKWQNTGRDKTARFYEYSENIDLSKRKKWAHILNKDEAQQYLNDYFKFINYKI